MDKVKHTPGPWEATELCSIPPWIKISADAASIADVQLWRNSEPGDKEESEANGRLIAAAPNGLELAKAVVDLSLAMEHRGPWQDFERVLDQARSLIAKVEGTDHAEKP